MWAAGWSTTRAIERPPPRLDWRCAALLRLRSGKGLRSCSLKYVVAQAIVVFEDLRNERRAAYQGSERAAVGEGATVPVNGEGRWWSLPAAWQVVMREVSRIVLRGDRGLGARIAADGLRNFGSDDVGRWQLVLVTCDLRCAEKSPPSRQTGVEGESFIRQMRTLPHNFHPNLPSITSKLSTLRMANNSNTPISPSIGWV